MRKVCLIIVTVSLLALLSCDTSNLSKKAAYYNGVLDGVKMTKHVTETGDREEAYKLYDKYHELELKE